MEQWNQQVHSNRQTKSNFTRSKPSINPPEPGLSDFPNQLKLVKGTWPSIQDPKQVLHNNPKPPDIKLIYLSTNSSKTVTLILHPEIQHRPKPNPAWNSVRNIPIDERIGSPLPKWTENTKTNNILQKRLINLNNAGEEQPWQSCPCLRAGVHVLADREKEALGWDQYVEVPARGY